MGYDDTGGSSFTTRKRKSTLNRRKECLNSRDEIEWGAPVTFEEEEREEEWEEEGREEEEEGREENDERDGRYEKYDKRAITRGVGGGRQRPYMRGKINSRVQIWREGAKVRSRRGRRGLVQYFMIAVAVLAAFLSYRLVRISLDRRQRKLKGTGRNKIIGYHGEGENDGRGYDRDYESWKDMGNSAKEMIEAIRKESLVKARQSVMMAQTLEEMAKDAVGAVEGALLGEIEEEATRADYKPKAEAKVVAKNAAAKTPQGDEGAADPLPQENIAYKQANDLVGKYDYNNDDDDDDDDNGKLEIITVEEAVKCGVWLAETSSSRWTGWTGWEGWKEEDNNYYKHKAMGLYAGKHFVEGQEIFPGGDAAIPYFDLIKHQGSEVAHSFFWESYAWDDDVNGMMSHEADEVGVASPGTGTLLGCVMNSEWNIGNVEEGEIATDGGGETPLHRSQDQGAGAFTPYIRSATAAEEISAGHELRALSLLNPNRCRNLEQSMSPKFRAHNNLLRELKAEDQWIEKTKAPSIQWLEDNGRCADNIRMGSSQIPQAGRGAIATRGMKVGEVVMPVPLMHFPDRSVMALYGDEKTEYLLDGTIHITKHVVGHQPLLNYCFGHPETTVLLCPYGHGSSLVNHDPTFANVAIRWADPDRSIHRPDVLESTVDDLREMSSTPMLAWELVATSTIKEGEEIFLNYGEAWQRAWEEHIAVWTPPERSQKYHSAREVNDSPSFLKLLKKKKIPKNMALLADDGSGGDTMYNCTIESWRVEEEGEEWEAEGIASTGQALFTAWFAEDGTLLVDATKDSFKFLDKPYTTDLHLSRVFSHEMSIPDKILPETWKNIHKFK